MSDVEDGELLSSDNEDFAQPICKEDKKEKTKHRDKNLILMNNNQYNLIDKWNFHKNEENFRHNHKRSNNSPYSYENDRKRNRHTKNNSCESKRFRKSINQDINDRECFAPIKNEICRDLKIEHSNHQDNCNPIKRKILCKYFASGECKNGVNCLFMHEDFPCKFYHDKTLICRAGNNCKYSHSPLTENMKTVIDCFIQDRKENKSTISDSSVISSYNVTTSVHNRIKCLLPTPNMSNTISQINDQSESMENKSYIFSSQIHNNEESCKLKTEKSFISYNQNSFSDCENKIVHSSIANNQRFTSNNIQRIPIESEDKSIFTSIKDLNIHTVTNMSQSDKHVNFQCDQTDPISFRKINFVQSQPSCDIRMNYHVKTQSNNYNNHAPARFIIGNNNQISDTCDNVKEALIKLENQSEKEITQSPDNSKDTTDCVDDLKKEIKEELFSPNLVIKNEAKSLNSVKQEQIQVSTTKIAKNKLVFNINEVNLRKTYFSKTIPWIAIKLDLVEKQPYISFDLTVVDVHENATLDPRLTDHPVLQAIEIQNDPDETPFQMSSQSFDDIKDKKFKYLSPNV